MIEIYRYTNTQSGNVEYSADGEKCEKYDNTDGYVRKERITLHDEEYLQAPVQQQEVYKTLEQALTRLQKRYAELEGRVQPQQEPVAWMFQHEETGRTMCIDAQQLGWGFEKGNPRLKKIAPLYTTPPQRTWVGLTDGEMHECWGDPLTPLGMTCARAIEAKLKEKNT